MNISFTRSLNFVRSVALAVAAASCSHQPPPPESKESTETNFTVLVRCIDSKKIETSGEYIGDLIKKMTVRAWLENTEAGKQCAEKCRQAGIKPSAEAFLLGEDSIRPVGGSQDSCGLNAILEVDLRGVLFFCGR